MIKTSGSIKIIPNVAAKVQDAVAVAFSAHILAQINDYQQYIHEKLVPQIQSTIESFAKAEIDALGGREVAVKSDLSPQDARTSGIGSNFGIEVVKEGDKYRVYIIFGTRKVDFALHDTTDEVIESWNKYIMPEIQVLNRFLASPISESVLSLKEEVEKISGGRAAALSSKSFKEQIPLDLDGWEYIQDLTQSRKKVLQRFISSNKSSISHLTDQVVGAEASSILEGDYLFDEYGRKHRIVVAVDIEKDKLVQISDEYGVEETDLGTLKNPGAGDIIRLIDSNGMFTDKLKRAQELNLESALHQAGWEYLDLEVEVQDNPEIHGQISGKNIVMYVPGTIDLRLDKFHEALSQINKYVSHELQHLSQDIINASVLWTIEEGGLAPQSIRKKKDYDIMGLPVDMDRGDIDIKKLTEEGKIETHSLREVEFYPRLSSEIHDFIALEIPEKLRSRAVRIFAGLESGKLIPLDPTEEFKAEYGLPPDFSFKKDNLIDGELWTAQELRALSAEIRPNTFFVDLRYNEPDKWQRAVSELVSMLNK